MAEKIFTAKKNGALFAQLEGPNTKPEWLGCFDVDDVVENTGTTNPIFCFDEDGNWADAGFTENPPENIPLTLGTYSGKRKEIIETAMCPWSAYLVLRCEGKADLFEAWDRISALSVRKTTGRTFTGWVKRNEDAAAETLIAAEASPFIVDGIRLTGAKVDVPNANTIDATSIAFNEDTQCEGACGDRKDVCEVGIISYKADAGSPGASPVPQVTIDGGVTWTSATSPFGLFGAGIDTRGTAVFQIDANVDRMLIGQGTGIALKPPIVAYSDDVGVTWTDVNLQTLINDYIDSPNGIYVVNQWQIFVGTFLGNIHKSEDGGATYTLVFDGNTLNTANPIHGFAFRDAENGRAVSVSGQVLVTVDGGNSWVVESVIDSGSADNWEIEYNGLFWWIGDDAGQLWYQHRDSSTPTVWTERTSFAGKGSGTAIGIEFDSVYTGLALVSDIGNNGARLFQTVNGGWSWQEIPIVATDDMYGLFVCSSDRAWLAGNSNVVQKIKTK